MNQLENELRDLLGTRAETVSAAPERHASTLRRAKGRRRATVGMALVATVAIVTGGVAVGRSALFDGKPMPPTKQGHDHNTEGPYGFSSEEGTYPVIASGTFGDSTWELRGERGTRYEGAVEVIRVELDITSESGESFSSKTFVLPGDDTLLIKHAEGDEVLDGQAGVVFGATGSWVDSVLVEMADGRETTITPHLFTDYESGTDLSGHYFIAFLPPGSPAFVAARDELGINLELEEVGRVSLAPHVVTGGRVGDENWSLEFAGGLQRDRACLVFAPDEQGTRCFMRAELEQAGPLFVTVFDRDDVKGIVAILADDVGSVRLRIPGRGPAILPTFEPDRSELREWPVRIVAVGLEPGTEGRLEALDGSRKVMERYDF